VVSPVSLDVGMALHEPVTCFVGKEACDFARNIDGRTRLLSGTGELRATVNVPSGHEFRSRVSHGTRRQELLPESATQYFLRDEPRRIVFNVDSNGKAIGLEFITTMVHWHRDKNP